MAKYDLVIFDLDGTIINSSPGIYSTANWTMSQLGLPVEVDMKQLKKFIGPPLKDCFKVTYNLEDSLLEKACEIYREGYAKHGKYLSTLYDGIEDVFKTLNSKSIKCAIGTMKNEPMAIDIAKNLDIYNQFEVIVGSDDLGNITKADVIRKIVKEVNVDLDRVVLVGDTEYDLIGAKDANVDFIAVTYGFGFTSDLQINSNITNIATSPKDILSCIL